MGGSLAGIVSAHGSLPATRLPLQTNWFGDQRLLPIGISPLASSNADEGLPALTGRDHDLEHSIRRHRGRPV